MPTATLFRFESSSIRTSTYHLGYHHYAPGRSWKGAYSEFIFTDGTESLATKQQIEGYLAWKWGLEANLPITHPYKTSAPIV